MSNIICNKKACKHLMWNVFYGLLCEKSSVNIDNLRCVDYEKLTLEERKEKDKRYGFKIFTE